MFNNNENKELVSKPSRIITNIINSDKNTFVILKFTFAIAVTILGLLRLIIAFQLLSPPYLYHKDIIQEYILGRAIIEGVEPYLPLPMLVNRFVGDIPVDVLPHATPHPPFVAVFSIPFGFITLEQTAAFWLLFELICLFWIAYRLSDWFFRGNRSKWIFASFSFFLLLFTQPVWEELIYGQLMILLLLLLVELWISMRNKRSIRAGIYLGLAVSIKLIAWPFLIFWMIKKEWKTLVTSLISIALTNLTAAIVVGSVQFIHYFLKISTEVYAIYRGFNFSSSSLGWRMFEKTGTEAVPSIHASPLIYSPGLATVTSIIIPVVFLMVGVISSLKSSSIDISVGILVLTILLVSPVVWYHYFVLAIIPFCIALKHSFQLKIRPIDSLLLLSGLCLFAIPNSTPIRFLSFITKTFTNQADQSSLPFALSMFTYIFPLLVIGLFVLLIRYSRYSTQIENPLINKSMI